MSTTLPLLDSEISAAIKRRLGELCLNKGATQIRLPLKSVSIESTVAERIAEVTVEQQFHNPYSDPLEAVYIFPLAGGSAVSSFELKVGDQVVVGKVEERQKARQVYQQALTDGKRAALLEQERDNVFTVSLGNLPPGDCVSVTIKYSEKLPYYEDGTTELRLPLVVASRYVPGAPADRDQVGSGTQLDTDQVPDASRISPARLAPGVKPEVELGISVKLLGTNSIDKLSCSQHATRLSADPGSMTIALDRTDELLDRDFVLRWRIAGEKIQPRFLVHASKDKKQPSFGMLSILPPQNQEVAMPGRDIIFLLDRSGSMHGQKMVSAVRACSYLIAALGPKDRFAVQAFDDNFEWMPATDDNDHFVVADTAGIDAGAKYLRTIDARGGTELNLAISLALRSMKNRDKTSTRMPVIVVLTDGEVSNESATLKNIQTELGDNRIFTIGIDTAVNDGLLRRVAALAGGTCTFVQPGTQLEEALNQVGREIGRVLVTDIKLASSTSTILSDSIAPSRIPDLYDGRATTCFFQLDKFARNKNASIEISGKLADGSAYSQTIKAELVEISALPQLWAKQHVVDLEDNYRLVSGPQQETIRQEIVKLAVEHTLLTRFTAFVAVHEDEAISDPSRCRTVVQAVHEAQGWAPPMNQPMPQSQMFMSQPAPMSAGSCGFIPAGTFDVDGCAQGGSDIRRDIEIGTRMTPRAQNRPSFLLGADELVTGTWRAFIPPTCGSGGPMAGGAPQMQPQPQQAPNSAAKNSIGDERNSIRDEVENVAQAFDLLDRLLEQAYKDIKARRVPDLDKIEAARTDLLNVLAASSLATQLPLLQKFLRATVLELIAASWGDASSARKVTLGQVMQLGRLQEESWQEVKKETTAIFYELKKPFWECSI